MSIETLLLEAASKHSPWKASCRVAASANLTLVGEQTIDGVVCQENDRILPTAQTDPKENGPWIMKRTGWVRPVDYNDARGAVHATTVPVTAGTANSGIWRMTAPVVGEVQPGLTATTWTKVAEFAPVLSSSDWKDSVRAASTANIDLAAPGAAIDGVTMAAGNRFLAKDQTAAAANGIYVWNGAAVPATRATDADTSAKVTGGIAVRVNEGTTQADTDWRLTTNDPIVLGTTALVFATFSGGGGAGDIEGIDTPAGSGLQGGALSGTPSLSVNLGDTGKFTEAGVASRGAVFNSSGQLVAPSLVAGDIIRTGIGDVRVGVGGATVSNFRVVATTVDLDGNIDADGTTCALDFATSCTITSPTIALAGSTAITQQAPSIKRGADVAAGARVEGAVNGTSWQEVWKGTAGTTGLTITSNATASSIVSVGDMTMGQSTALWTVSNFGANLAALLAHSIYIRSLSGNAQLNAVNGVVQVVAGTTLELQSNGRRINFRTASDGDRGSIWLFADGSTTNDTQGTLATLTPDTARPSAYEVFAFVENSSGAMKAWHNIVPARGQGGSAAFAGGSSPVAGVVLGTADAAVAACAFELDTSTTTIRARNTGIAATTLNWTIWVRGML